MKINRKTNQIELYIMIYKFKTFENGIGLWWKIQQQQYNVISFNMNFSICKLLLTDVKYIGIWFFMLMVQSLNLAYRSRPKTIYYLSRTNGLLNGGCDFWLTQNLRYFQINKKHLYFVVYNDIQQGLSHSWWAHDYIWYFTLCIEGFWNGFWHI